MRRMPSLVLAAVLVALVAAPVAAAEGPVTRPGASERVSVGLEGTDPDASSSAPVISGNGRLVAFTSDATNLVTGDTNGTQDVFVHDRVTGRTERASVASSGAEADGLSADPEISADGRFVAFTSAASNLVPEDTNGTYDVFVRDLVLGTTERVSVGADGAQSPEGANDATINADGRYVGFSSSSTNLVPGDTNGWGDAFVRDRLAETTFRVSLGTGGVEANLGGGDPDLSPDGGHVAFTSISTNLDGVDGSVGGDIFVRDLAADRTRLVSVGHDGSPANEQSAVPAVSADGRFVVFRSRASNLVPGDRNTIHDFFVRDVEAGRTERVSVSSAGASGEGVWTGIPAPVITPDGRHVAFSTISPGLVPGDENQNLDVFVHDRVVGSTEIVTIRAGGAQAHGTKASISDDGRHVGFLSDHGGIVPGDANDSADVFVRDRGPVLGPAVAEVTQAGGFTEVQGWATFSGLSIASAVDPAGDASAGLAGSDLTGASIAYRPHT
ncbi:MAG TPA: hypothetical protein VM638_03270, partial [Actinomycetota bacterium]|nr:hypothetical protein [Actinomycetota bacterium]